jgi:hypothetical protein
MKSDDCSSGIHEFCNQCDCSCHNEEEKYLTKEEIGVLYNFLKHEFVTYDDGPLYQVIKKISEIANRRIDG